MRTLDIPYKEVRRIVEMSQEEFLVYTKDLAVFFKSGYKKELCPKLFGKKIISSHEDSDGSWVKLDEDTPHYRQIIVTESADAGYKNAFDYIYSEEFTIREKVLTRKSVVNGEEINQRLFLYKVRLIRETLINNRPFIGDIKITEAYCLAESEEGAIDQCYGLAFEDIKLPYIVQSEYPLVDKTAERIPFCIRGWGKDKF